MVFLKIFVKVVPDLFNQCILLIKDDIINIYIFFSFAKNGMKLSGLELCGW